ncbi:MAG: RraA family protein [Alphaproteobacteria bacterium]
MAAEADEPALTARLERCYTGAVHDVLRAMGERNFVLPETIRALDPTLRLAGPAFTVSGHYDETLDAHATLLAWTGLLSRARRGAVVVCQPNTSACALMGELSAETLKHRGVRGYVVDGATRDVELILALGFPVYCRFATPSDIVAKWTPDRFEEPVVIGAVTIASGDYILADRDGVVRIPRVRAVEAVRRSEEVIGTENLLRKAILDGMDPQEAYLKFGKF